MPRFTKADKLVRERMKDIRDLLSEFGLVLHGYDPGVTCYRADGTGGLLDFGRGEWAVLEPLLVELRNYHREAESNG